MASEQWGLLRERFAKLSTQGKIRHALMLRVGITHDEDERDWKLDLGHYAGSPCGRLWWHNLTVAENGHSLATCYFGVWEDELGDYLDAAAAALVLLADNFPLPTPCPRKWEVYLCWLALSQQTLPIRINVFTQSNTDNIQTQIQCPDDFNRLLRGDGLPFGRYFFLLSGDVRVCSEAVALNLSVRRTDGEQPVEPPKPAHKKRSTEKGEARLKIIAALTEHHKYEAGSYMNPEPVGVAELARQAQVAKATVSVFFKNEFEGHAKYKVCCRHPSGLTKALKLLNNEYSPYHLYGEKPPNEDDRDDDY